MYFNLFSWYEQSKQFPFENSDQTQPKGQSDQDNKVMKMNYYLGIIDWIWILRQKLSFIVIPD
jgi:hypothetical protein